MVPGIGNVEVAGGVERDAARQIQQGCGGSGPIPGRSRRTAGAGDRGDIAPVGGDHADAMIGGVGDIEVPLGIQRHGIGRVELRGQRVTIITHVPLGTGDAGQSLNGVLLATGGRKAEQAQAHYERTTPNLHGYIQCKRARRAGGYRNQCMVAAMIQQIPSATAPARMAAAILRSSAICFQRSSGASLTTSEKAMMKTTMPRPQKMRPLIKG